MKRKPIHITDEIFCIIRMFDAPLPLVFNAFTDPEHLMRWWKPKGFTLVFCKLDLRPGGMFHYCAKSPQGEALWGRFEYRDIQKEKRILFVNSFSDESGPGWRQEMLNKVTFKEENGRTIVTLTCESLNEEFNDAFDQLEYYLQTITTKKQIA